MVKLTGLIEGKIKKCEKTKQLIRTIQPGEIALICHRDLDPLAANGLIGAGVKAVVNAAPTLTGTFPNDGPGILIRSGVPIFEIEEKHFSALKDGTVVTIGDGKLNAGRTIVPCRMLTVGEIRDLTERGWSRVNATLHTFLENTLRHANAELTSFLQPLELPPLATVLRGRHALVVARGNGVADDLRSLAGYIRRERPVLIGVDGGADMLLSFGLKPDLIIGDMDSVSDEALQSGAELIVHAYPDGRAPGMETVLRLGLRAAAFSVRGTSEDAALLLAYEAGAERIVAVGHHTHMIDFLEKGRAGMASTLITRIKIGHRLIDAKGIALLGGDTAGVPSSSVKRRRLRGAAYAARRFFSWTQPIETATRLLYRRFFGNGVEFRGLYRDDRCTGAERGGPNRLDTCGIAPDRGLP